MIRSISLGNLTKNSVSPKKKSKVAVVILASLIALGPNHLLNSYAAEEVGKSTKIRNIVNASIGNRKLVKNDPVYASERVSAGSNSHGELVLSDNSKVLVGENSVISLDDFVVSSGGIESGTIKVAKGAFRFITGNAKKGTYRIKTPLSTIGIRGTKFDVYVAASGVTQVLLFKGSVEVCGSGSCMTISNPCDVVEANSGGVQSSAYFGFSERSKDLSDYSLTGNQSRFSPSHRVSTIACGARAALDPVRKTTNPNSTTGSPNGGTGAGSGRGKD